MGLAEAFCDFECNVDGLLASLTAMEFRMRFTGSSAVDRLQSVV